MTSPANLGGSIPPTPRTTNAYRTLRHNVRPWAKWEPPDDRAPTAHRVAPAGLSSTAIAAQRTGRGQMGIPQMTERPLRPGTGQTTLPTAPAEQQGALWKAGEKMGPGAATGNTVPSCHEPKWPHDHCWSPTGTARNNKMHTMCMFALQCGAPPTHAHLCMCVETHALLCMCAPQCVIGTISATCDPRPERPTWRTPCASHAPPSCGPWPLSGGEERHL